MPHQNIHPGLIRSLVELAREISEGQYGHADVLFDFTREDSHPPEIVELAESFGMMMVQVEAREYRLQQMIEELAAKNRELEQTLAKVEMLESIKNQLGKFVPSSVKSIIESNPTCPDLEKHDEDVTVLFLDIAGYSRMSEEIEQSTVNYLIETYFSNFLDIILQNRGDINETAGDGLMIIFRQPDPVAHAVNAARSALAIEEKTRLLNEAHRGQFTPVTVNIGINSGLCSVGSTRFQGRAGARWTYTASGPVTNIAARISAIATGGAILAGEETFSRIRDQFAFSAMSRHQVKNIQDPVQVCRLLSPKS